MSDINIQAFNKLVSTFDYAEKCNTRDPSGNTVVRLSLNSATDGQSSIRCSYSKTDAPRTFLHFFIRGGDAINANNRTRDIFKQSVIAVFGTTINDVPKSVRDAMKLEDYDNKGHPLTSRRILAVQQEICALVLVDPKFKALANAIGFKGNAAGKIMMIAGAKSGLAEMDDPAKEFKSRAATIAKAGYQTLFAANAKMGAEIASELGMDLKRGWSITLDGEIVSSDLNEAKDQFIRFVSGNPSLTWASADEATKRKTALLMNSVHQGFQAVVMTGVGFAFSADASTCIFQPNKAPNNTVRTDTHDIRRDGNGNITIDSVLSYTKCFSVLLTPDDKVLLSKTEVSDGVHAIYSANVAYPEAELDKIVKAELEGKADDYDEDATRTMEKSFTPHCNERAAEMVPEDLKLNCSFTIGMDVEINELREIEAED